MNAPAPDGLPAPRRLRAAAAIWLAIAMAVLDSAIANVALPAIARDVGADAAQSIWVVSAYQIAIVIGLLPAAALGEAVGYRRVYLAGLALFVTASVGCALSHSLIALSFARFAQGFGAAGVMAINGALVRFTYPRAELARGIARNALMVALSAAAGPSVASAILSVAPWPWLFAVNAPFGLLALAIGRRALPDSPRGAPVDWTAAGLNAAAFGGLFLGAADLGHGTVTPGSLSTLAVGGMAAVALWLHERRRTAPLVPLDLLAIPVLRLSYAASASAFGAQMAAFVSLPFVLESRFGIDPSRAGLYITPWPLALMVAAPLSARLLERASAAVLGAAGLGLLALGLLVLALIPAGAPPALLVGSVALCGFGFGLFQTPNNRTILGAAPIARAAAASGMLAAGRLVGQTLGGVAVAGLFRLLSPSSPVVFALAAAVALMAAGFSLSRRRAASAGAARADAQAQAAASRP